MEHLQIFMKMQENGFVKKKQLKSEVGLRSVKKG